jgi:hypothetical protein
MDEKINSYIASQPQGRWSILAALHAIILEEDKTVIAAIAPMMGKEMIVYKSSGAMKYGLASGKNHMSFHVLPMYASKPIFEKYKSVLNEANFQKGCINFDKAEKMPLDKVRQLVNYSSKVDLLKIREEYQKKK